MNIIIRQITNRSIVFYRCKSFFVVLSIGIKLREEEEEKDLPC